MKSPIKTDEPLINVEYKEPVSPTQKEQRTENLFGLVRTVSAVPTHTPRKFDEQILIYTSGVTYRLYWYDATNNAWRYATGT